MTETQEKVDKRTKAYRDGRNAGVFGAGDGQEQEIRDGVTDHIVGKEPDKTVFPGEDRTFATEELLREILGIAQEVLHFLREPKPSEDVPVAEKEPGMTPVKDLTKCLKCGVALPKLTDNESRHQPEACHKCIWENA